jgi:putative resolvase
VARVFRDRASGPREDRLARFGAGWLRRLPAAHGATVEVLHPKAQGGREELLEDFISLVTTFAGRLYGMRSAAARRRLLAESGTAPSGGGQ